MKISILGMRYTVEESNVILEHGESGNCSFDSLKISIDAGLPPDSYNRALLHEIIHAALYELGQEEASQDEKLVDNLALALYQTLRDCGALDTNRSPFKKTPRG